MIEIKNILETLLKSQSSIFEISKMMDIPPDLLKDFINEQLSQNKAVIHIDGGSRGNPGIAGCGVLLETKNQKEGFYFYIGTATNNFAEYNALYEALQISIEKKLKNVQVYTDSQLVAKQINGEYKVKNENIKPLFEDCITLISHFENFKIIHIKRELNKEADKLANKAMDLKESGKVKFAVAH